jgi:hypothetical protein
MGYLVAQCPFDTPTKFTRKIAAFGQLSGSLLEIV